MTRFPRVQPLPTMRPWSAPQTIEAVPEIRTMRPAIASGAVVQASQSTAVREAHRYAQINGSIILETTATSALMLASPQNFRNMLIMRNAGSNTIYIEFGRDATTDAPVILQTNQMILFDTVVPQDDIFALSTVGLSKLSIGFSNLNFLGPVE